MLATGTAKIQVSMYAYLRMTAFVEIESKWFGFGIKDASAGLKLEGGLDLSCDISVGGELRFVRLFYMCTVMLYPYCKEILQKMCLRWLKGHLEVKYHPQRIFMFTTDSSQF